MADLLQDDEPAERREAVVARWNELCRKVLPGMAAASGWPIHLDHCFMRVFLDAAAGGRWDMVVQRPAVRHMELPTLRRAVELAEAVVAAPERLPAMNAASLAWRRSGPGGSARRGRPAA